MSEPTAVAPKPHGAHDAHGAHAHHEELDATGRCLVSKVLVRCAGQTAACERGDVDVGVQAGVRVENQVIGWLVELLGMPAGTHGLLVSGGSMARKPTT